jgi:hypothetical protein
MNPPRLTYTAAATRLAAILMVVWLVEGASAEAQTAETNRVTQQGKSVREPLEDLVRPDTFPGLAGPDGATPAKSAAGAAQRPAFPDGTTEVEMAGQLGKLRQAIALARSKELQTLLQKSPGLANGRDPFTPPMHETPLTQAVSIYGREHHGPGADIHTVFPRWMQYTTVGRHMKIVELLLAHKADVNATNGMGVAPLHLAAGAGAGPSVDEDHQVRRLQERADLVPLLLARKADVNVRDTQGDTPLHIAARRSNQKVAALLLTHKADVNARNHQGQMPLDVVAGPNREAIARLLRARGAERQGSVR